MTPGKSSSTRNKQVKNSIASLEDRESKSEASISSRSCSASLLSGRRSRVSIESKKSLIADLKSADDKRTLSASFAQSLVQVLTPSQDVLRVLSGNAI